MPETLVLRVSASSKKPHSWLVVDSNGTRIGDVMHGPLADIGPGVEQRQMVALLPASQCLVTHSNLPLKNAQKLMQALPFEFEDQLIDGIDDTHFAHGARDENGRFPVGAIRRDELEAILATFGKHALHPMRVIPEASALPITEGGCSVLLEADEGMIRTANGDAAVMHHSALMIALQLAQQALHIDDSDAAPMPVTVFIDDSSAQSGEQAIAAIHEQFPGAEFRRLPHGALSKLAVTALQPGLPNMLQGKYAPSTSFEKTFEPWRYPAIAAALLLAVTIGYKALELSVMKSRYAQINTTILELARTTFPARSQISNPVQLFRQEARNNLIDVGAGNSEFIQLLEVVAKASGESAELNVHRLNYRPGNLDLEVTAPNVQILDSLTNRITEQERWTASLQSTKPAGNAVQGRMSIQGVIEEAQP